MEHWKFIATDLYDAILVLSETFDAMPTPIEDLVGREEWHKISRSMRHYEAAINEE